MHQRPHEKYDWSDLFRLRDLSKSLQGSFLSQENSGALPVAFLTFVLFSTVLQKSGTRSATEIQLEAGLAFVVGAVLIGHIIVMNRRYFHQSLEKVIGNFSKIEFGERRPLLALHSSQMLAQFETTFNTLSQRLDAAENELGRKINREAERSRMQTLGEISALIAHDLAGPLHGLQFCVESLLEQEESLSDVKLIDETRANLSRAQELVGSLRAYLKNQTSSSVATFGEAHRYVVELLTTQFRHSGFQPENWFTFDPKLNPTEVAVPRIDLIHFLDNLYRNAVQNLIANKQTNPRIVIERATSETPGFVVVQITDNGSGLSHESFERLTTEAGEGLGLRLTRQLVERNGGTLSWTAAQGPGTRLLLQLRNRPRAVALQKTSERFAHVDA